MKKRIVSILTALALCLSLCPVWAFAEETDSALCPHHQTHNENCGYAAPIEGQPCEHEHIAGCWTQSEPSNTDGDYSANADTEPQLDCRHTHDTECGYIPAAPGTPCGYICKLCPIEEKIAVLPAEVNPDNAEEVWAQLNEILTLFSELSEDQQELVDITPCLKLQEKLDVANAASPLADEIALNSRITINSGNLDQFNNKVITGSTTNNHLTIDNVTVNLTIQDLNLQLEGSTDVNSGLVHAGIALHNNATLHLTIEGTNTIKGGDMYAAISVPEGCTLTIDGSGSLTAKGGTGAAGIGADWRGHQTTQSKTVGTIVINSGTVNAYGTSGGAGIGGTQGGSTGSVTINGGIVYAQGSGSVDSKGMPYSAAGIGGGGAGKLGSIKITGGSVTAIGHKNSDAPDTMAAAGIGAGDTGYMSGAESTVDCGSIEITGGTVIAQGGGDYSIGFGAAYGSDLSTAGSVKVSGDAAVTLKGGKINPVPAEGTVYQVNVIAYDTAITGNQTDAVFSVGGRNYNVSIIKDEAQPYSGGCSFYTILPAADSQTATLRCGGRTYEQTSSASEDTLSFVFGQQRYAYYSLTVLIYDEAITQSMDAQVSLEGITKQVTMECPAKYLGKIQADKLIFDKEAANRTSAVTVTAGGHTWFGDASDGTGKQLTIGQPIQPAEFTLDLALGTITFAEDIITYYEDGAERTTPLDATKIYEVIQSNSETASTTNQLIVSSSHQVHIRIKNLNMSNNGGNYSPIDITGNAILEIVGTNNVVSKTVFKQSIFYYGKPSIHVSSSGNLELTGSGTLEATANPGGTQLTFGCPGIGGDYKESSGNIIIQSGKITAEGGKYAAGIGGSHNGNGTVTITGGTVIATGNGYGAGIGGGYYGQGEVTITGGMVTANGATDGGNGSAGIGGGYKGKGTVTITGGVVTANGGQRANGIGNGADDDSGSATITGGSIEASSNGGVSAVLSPKNNNSADLHLVTITLDGVGSDVPVAGVTGIEGGYGCKDVYTRDGGKLYFYLPANTLPTSITVGGVDYVPESEGNPKYVVDFQVELKGYPLTKVYDGQAMAEPAANQVESNATDLTFAWYQGETPVSAPMNAGSYTLRVSSDKGSKDFDVTITKRPLTITAQAQTIDYSGSIEQEKYTHNGLAAGDTLTVTLVASQPPVGTHTGAITATAQITRDGADVMGNYTITSNPGTLTINKAAPTVSVWPTASTITYGQALSDSTLTGGDTDGEFAWKNGTVKPNAGTQSYTVIFTPNDTNYDTASQDISVTVNPAPLTITAREQTITYGGSIQTGTGQVEAALAAGDTLTAVQMSASAVDAGTYESGITVTGAKIEYGDTDVTENYTITYGSGKLIIQPKMVDNPTIELSQNCFEYDGSEKKPAVTTVKDGDTVISPNEYTVEYGNNTNVGTAAVTITDKDGGNYVVSGGGSFTITAKPLAGAAVNVSGAFTYSGSDHTPEPVVTLGGRTLEKDTDYTVSYTDNVNAGTANVTIVGKGNYSGTASGTFTIGKAVLTADGTGIAKGTYGDTLSALTVEGLTARLNGTIVNGSWTLTGETVPNVGDSGEYTAIFTPSSSAGNYNELTAPVTLDISKADYTGTKNVNTSGRYGKTKTYELADLLPDGYVLGTVTITDSHGIFDGTPAVNGTTLTYGLADNRDNVDETGTIIVPVTSSTNYNAFDLAIVVTVTNVQVPDLNVNPIQVTYTGNPVPDSSISGTAVVDGISIDGTWSFVEGQDITNAADSGAKEVKFTPKDTTLYGPNTGTVTVTISKATPSLTLTPSPATLPSGGTVTLTLTGLPEGGSAAVTCSDENISVTEGNGNTWTAELPDGGASYIFTASYAGDGNHNSASADCTVSVEKITPDLSLTATPNSLRGGGTVTLTLTGLPAGSTAAVTCSGDITATAGVGNTWTATLPNSAATYTFTADFAGSDSHNSASTSCNVSVTAVTALPNPPAAEDGKQYQLVMEDGISEVPAGLQSIEALNTPAKLEFALRTAITQANSSVPQDNAAVYDVELQVSTDGGATWTKASAGNFPANGLTVTLPYPAGTDSSYTFTVVYMFTTGDFGKIPGDTETPRVTNTASGLQFIVTGLSPISVGWEQPSAPVTPSTPSGGGGGGGSSSSKPAITSEPHNTQKPCDGGADCPSHGFTDLVNVGAWYHEAVDFVLRNGFMNGYTSTLFGPDENLSRAQLAQILYNKEGKPSVTGNGVFIDVDNGAWYALAIIWAAGSGIVGGYGNGRFGPNDNITREQLAVMLWRYAGNPAATDKELHFADAGKASRYAVEALRWAVENGIINGKDGDILDPQGLATRAQVAQMLKNLLEK